MPTALAAAVLAVAAADPGGAFDMIVAAPGGPLRVRVAVTLDRRPLSDGPDRYREALVRRLDGDGDGAVSRDEAAAAPTPRVLGAAGDGAAAQEALDDLLARFAAAEAGGRPGLPAAEFAAWAAGVMGPPVRAAVREPAGAAADLCELLDADGDGVLTPAELSADTLARRDFDADGTLAAAELAPFRDPAAGGDRRQFPPGAPFRLDPAPPAGAEPDVTVAVSLVARSFGLPRAKVAATGAADRVSVEAERRGFTLTVDDALTLTFAADRAENVGSDAVSLGLLEVVKADADANGYLDPDEFAAAALPGAPAFKDVDRDGDEMAVRDEIRAYLEEDVRLSGSRIYVLTEAAAAGLFGPLDADGDGRLTPAERAAAAADLAAGRFPPDRDGDGAVRRSELAAEYAVRVGPGRPRPPDDGGMMVTAEQTDGVPGRATAGPRWFVGSDRNGDGVLTWPEFVGPRAAFDRLDADADGSVTPAEAEAPAGAESG